MSDANAIRDIMTERNVAIAAKVSSKAAAAEQHNALSEAICDAIGDRPEKGRSVLAVLDNTLFVVELRGENLFVSTHNVTVLG